MGEKTKIAWTDSTWNGWLGCTKVGAGCDHCYAEALLDSRLKAVQWGPKSARKRTSAANWKVPRRWNRRHAKFFAEHGRRQRVFSSSLSDWLDNEVPVEWLVDLLQLVHETPNLDWLLLTKRIGNIGPRLTEAYQWLSAVPTDRNPEFVRWLRDWLRGDAPTNVWLGITVVNQAEADRDIPKLLAAAARVRFLSMEPLLGPVDLNYAFGIPSGAGRGSCPMHLATVCPEGLRPHGEQHLHWVIVGGESGRGARNFDIGWARSIVQQCAAAGVPVFVKQMGARPVWNEVDDGIAEPPFFGRISYVDEKGSNPDEWPAELRVRQHPRSAAAAEQVAP